MAVVRFEHIFVDKLSLDFSVCNLSLKIGLDSWDIFLCKKKKQLEMTW